MPPAFMDLDRPGAPYQGNFSMIQDIHRRAEAAFQAIGCPGAWADSNKTLFHVVEALDNCHLGPDVNAEVALAQELAQAALDDAGMGRDELQGRIRFNKAAATAAMGALYQEGGLAATDLELGIELAWMLVLRGYGDDHERYWLAMYDDLLQGRERFSETDLETVQWFFYNTFFDAPRSAATQAFAESFEWRLGACQILYSDERLSALRDSAEMAREMAVALQGIVSGKRDSDYWVRDFEATLQFFQELPSTDALALANAERNFQRQLGHFTLLAQDEWPPWASATDLVRQDAARQGSLLASNDLAIMDESLTEREYWDQSAFMRANLLSYAGLDYPPAMTCE